MYACPYMHPVFKLFWDEYLNNIFSNFYIVLILYVRLSSYLIS